MILSRSNLDDLSVDKYYVTGNACKVNESTDLLVDLFNDMRNDADEAARATAKS